MSVQTAKQILIPIASGSEEIEFTTIVSIFRRAGAIVTIASVDSKLIVSGSRSIPIVADILLTDLLKQQPLIEYDAILLPGGIEGAKSFGANKQLIELLHQQRQSGRLYGAICASPALALSTNQLIPTDPSSKYTAVGHPSLWSKLLNDSNQSLYNSQEELLAQPRVIQYNNLLTSIAAGSAMEFALYAVAILYGIEHAQSLTEPQLMTNFKLDQNVIKPLSKL